MIWLLLTVVVAIIVYASSERGDRGGNATGALFVGALLSLCANVALPTWLTTETNGSQKITSDIVREVVNDKVVLTFTTEDGSKWSLPLDTETAVGTENRLVWHDFHEPNNWWSIFPAAQNDYQSLSLAP